VIVYGAKRVGGKLLLRRWFNKRISDRNKRLDLDMKKLRKKWWHFRTRWTVKS
jgi:hypothetical protein